MVRSFKLTANKQAALSKSNLRDAEIATHHSTFTVQYSLFVCLFVYLSVYLYVSCSVRLRYVCQFIALYFYPYDGE